MRTVGVVTVGRSDYGLYTPILRKIQADPELRLHLIVTGMHLSPEFGSTVESIETDGFEIGERIEMLLSSDTPEGIAKSIGLGVSGFAQAYSRLRPDILLVLGDRFEMHAAALAALPFMIPVAHIHGGEVTVGAMDDALRHSMTKLSHLHFVSTQEYARRVEQLGEEPWRITVSGAPGLDNLHTVPLLTAEDLKRSYGIDVSPSTLLVTFHPVTLEYEQAERQIGCLLAAIKDAGLPIVFTLPNADTNGRIIARHIREFVDTQPCAQMVDNLGTPAYFSMMSLAGAMVGNSSSGLTEAASFRLPVVNIGTRQDGRLRPANVIDVGYESDEILAGINKGLSLDFRESLRDLVNPFGTGRASETIVQRLKNVPLDSRLITKRFHDVTEPVYSGATPSP